MSPDESDKLIDALLEGDISEADFLRLEAEMIVSEEVRQAYYDRQKLHLGLRVEAESAAGLAGKAPTSVGGSARRTWKPDWVMVCAIGALLLLVGVLGWRIGQDTRDYRAKREEPVASGFGVVVEESSADWTPGDGLAKGDLLPSGTLRLNAGIAQLELFSGVLLVVEGEAEFEVVSSTELLISRGNFRIQVPEQARGFRVKLPGAEISEPASAFVVAAAPDFIDLRVVEGELTWRVETGDVRSLSQGDSLRWNRQTGSVDDGSDFDQALLARLESFEASLTDQQAGRLEAWERASLKWRTDSRLIAYYPMDQPGDWNRRLVDESGNGIDGTIVRATRAMDRWGRPFGGLDFSATGSRVRLNIPGEFRSLTLMCWVKIDSLDRWYNSLFLTDGHELHEPHWQIMDDGRLFFSVKRRDAKNDKHVAYSPPIWTPAQSGQWMHLATVYDGDAGTTTHYLNGEAVSIDQIPEDMRIEKAEIGPASIGNWSEPKRNDPDFAMRNLNGTIDEFALFSAALSASEVHEIYEVGRP
ncbi:MAG: LamG domain-containing protein [Verrucomicrobiae bacterium]|nr:LamG domain-containing protein [Verrucomicrobiae bacterium]